MKKVTLITVNYNQSQVTREFLQSFFSVNDYPNTELIVVDNGSDFDLPQTLKHQYPQVVFIRSEENTGFAGGNNIGIKKATGDYLFFVNNDTEFTPKLVETLALTLDQHPEVGMASPKIMYFDKPDIIQYAGFSRMNFNVGRNHCIGQYEKDTGQYDHLTGPTGYVHGAAMMVRRDAIEKAGLMPEGFFLYYEEMDWCERIKRAGYQVWLEPRALIYHKESISVGKGSPLKEYYMTRNRILFIRRNAGFLAKIIFTLHFSFLVAPRNLMAYILKRRFDLLRAFIRGWVDGARNVHGNSFYQK